VLFLIYGVIAGDHNPEIIGEAYRFDKFPWHLFPGKQVPSVASANELRQELIAENPRLTINPTVLAQIEQVLLKPANSWWINVEPKKRKHNIKTLHWNAGYAPYTDEELQRKKLDQRRFTLAKLDVHEPLGEPPAVPESAAVLPEADNGLKSSEEQRVNEHYVELSELQPSRSTEEIAGYPSIRDPFGTGYPSYQYDNGYDSVEWSLESSLYSESEPHVRLPHFKQWRQTRVLQRIDAAADIE
jgi:hypothetical protein